MGGLVFSIVLTVHVLAGLGVIGLVLMQHGKGADMGLRSEAEPLAVCSGRPGPPTS